MEALKTTIFSKKNLQNGYMRIKYELSDNCAGIVSMGKLKRDRFLKIFQGGVK
jgi:hypothetical protein